MAKQILAVIVGTLLIGFGTWLTPGALAVLAGGVALGWGAFVADDGADR